MAHTTTAIREATAADYPALARLMRFTDDITVTPEGLEDRDTRFPSEGYKKRFLLDIDGEAIGFSSVVHWPHDRKTLYFLKVAVEPEYRRRGHGADLYRAAEEDAIEHGATELHIETRDDDQESSGFAKRRGYAFRQHVFQSTLKPESFDLARHAGAIERVTAQGLRLAALAEFADTEETRRKHWEIGIVTAADIPGFDPERPFTFEEYEGMFRPAAWFRPEGEIACLDGERWVGLAAVGEFSPGEYYSNHCGVLREYRGRGIALACKLLALDYAKRAGAKLFRTNNDANNSPMLAINRKVGYVDEPGWHMWRKHL